MKSLYVKAVRLARTPLRKAGVLGWLERHGGQRHARWARSLFAIYDIDDLVRLDMPWWTFRAMALVERWLVDRPGAEVFEYGAGASTVWLSRRAGRVRFVEHDAEWIKAIDRVCAAAGNVSGRAVPPDPAAAGSAYASRKRGWEGLDFERYVKSIHEEGARYDLIVIDGRCRARCLTEALTRLKDEGLIVFDNTNRARYQKAIRESGLATIETRGLTACLPYPDRTTLVFPSTAARDRLLAAMEEAPLGDPIRA